MSMPESPGRPSMGPTPSISSSSSLTTSPSSSGKSSSVEWRKRSGVSSRSSSRSETEVAEDISSSSVSPRVEMSDVSLNITAVCVSLLRGRNMYLMTRLDAGKFRSISAIEDVRAAMKFFSNIVFASCLVEDGKAVSASDINLEYLASKGSFDVLASLYARSACSRTNLRTKASSGSSSSFEFCSLRRLPVPPNSPVFVHSATSTRIVQADVLARFLNTTDSSCSIVPIGTSAFSSGSALREKLINSTFVRLYDERSSIGWSSALNAGFSAFLELRVACKSVVETEGEGSSVAISTSVWVSDCSGADVSVASVEGSLSSTSL
ncbi:unnamed protein product [Aspergillus oryzae RIB40]|uniref:DNA, SC003 n=2 Tax=Aspergillus oryzae TaxID=5062 RepID=Q2UJN9_ASPOR|nr:unnamed protein product [Aspergillus oryzae RIB40]EIT80856.1 hypothetical protein Ao3042_02649 [Aspergillus oryzae 3.042]KDE79170.1 hypothetical protein AO1008_05627 [Aspergillus oryzae 100-8]BAE58226.1 unnamed protein product [Aspergillus oryzae RIB40]|eukprot:EIT80856.1 hypothetical protein Ao3042_02649 [Aspergillus oryzae 3.042]